jgi:hypothetical protein
MSQGSFNPEAPMSRSQAERRQRRSPDPLTALGFILDTARQAQGFSALAVADSSGLLVAGAGRFADCEELAAHAPIQDPAKMIDCPPDAVEMVDIDGLEVLVAARSSGATPNLAAVAQGCVRILGRKLPKALH